MPINKNIYKYEYNILILLVFYLKFYSLYFSIVSKFSTLKKPYINRA